MEALYFEIVIKAPVEKVYTTMLSQESFKKWTSAFSPTSDFEGSWNKGSKIVFTAEDEKGNPCGMISRIKDNQPNRFVSIELLGLIENGQEIYDREDILSWKGMLEEYAYSTLGDSTHVKIRMDSTKEWKSFFTETYPKALHLLKDICES